MSLGLVALAAACGASARYLLDYLIVSRIRGSIPWGTFAVNITGSLALGLLAGLVLFQGVPADYKVVLGTGFLGAYTTFSTWMYETSRLIEEGAWRAVTGYTLGCLLIGPATAALGLWLTALL